MQSHPAFPQRSSGGSRRLCPHPVLLLVFRPLSAVCRFCRRHGSFHRSSTTRKRGWSVAPVSQSRKRCCHSPWRARHWLPVKKEHYQTREHESGDADTATAVAIHDSFSEACRQALIISVRTIAQTVSQHVTTCKFNVPELVQSVGEMLVFGLKCFFFFFNLSSCLVQEFLYFLY